VGGAEGETSGPGGETSRSKIKPVTKEIRLEVVAGIAFGALVPQADENLVKAIQTTVCGTFNP
jgi:hypothetical protein